MNICERLAAIQERIQLAATRVNRNPVEVKLLPVSKFNPIESIEAVMAAGISDFAESKVQELMDKQSKMPLTVNWHLIGHLQRNKVKYVVRMLNCRMIHSVDSVQLAREIERHCATLERTMDILIQVNVANDDAKFGVTLAEVFPLLQEVAELPHIRIKGLMTIVPEEDNPEKCRPYFRRLRELAKEIEQLRIPGVEMSELSMGMTGDFEVAIEEGATIVRIGSAIFGARSYQ